MTDAMIEGRPLPEPDEWSRGFWESCRGGRLSMQRCLQCLRFRFTPRPMCPRCGSLDWDYAPVSGRGTIYSWVVAHPPVLPAFRAAVPMAIVLVELEEDPGLRMIGNLMDCPNERIEIGMPVEVVFQDLGDDVTLPQWRRRTPADG
jgi:uncharacterized OB-fold protein